MKILSRFLLPVTIVFLCLSCSNESPISDNGNRDDRLVNMLSVTSEPVRFSSPATKAQYTVSDQDGFVLNWTLGDTIGIYPVGGDQHAFPISSGAGSSYAQFDGGSWALRANYEYAAYYPFSSSNYHVSETAIPVSYEGQTQTANGVTQHLAKYDYQAAAAIAPDKDGNIAVMLKHLGCFVRFQMLIPNPDSFTRLVLESSGTKFVTAGTFDLTQSAPAITPTRTAQSVTLTLDGVSTTEANQVLTMYMCLPPCNLSASTIHATLYGNMVQTYEQDLEGKNFEAGKAYAYNVESTEVTEFEGHEYVDLGLPSGNLWATCNIGATTPEAYGSRFMWGETTPKEYSYNWYYSWENYDGYVAPWTDSAPLDGDGFPTGPDIEHPAQYPDYGLDFCGTTHDAATVNWGGYWHMPTDVDMQELLDNCTWTSTTKNGVSGYKVTGTNGNWIFIPNVSIWTSTLSGYSQSDAQFLSGKRLSTTSRYYGYYARPVYNPNVTKIVVNNAYVYLEPGSMEQLNVSLFPANAADKSLTYSSSNPSVAAVSNTGHVLAIAVGGAEITVSQGSTVSAVAYACIPVKSGGHEYVDLGLSVKWATCNVGATSLEEYGDYFAWGETEPYYEPGYAQSSSPVWKSGKSAGYYWSSYKYCNGSYAQLTKYCNDSSYGDNGYTDTKTVLDLEDDAASVNWGGAWRMPTIDEQDELFNTSNCTWEWISLNGINGYVVVSKISSYAGNCIFLPAAGYRDDTNLYVVGSGGYYWSSSLGTDYPYDAYGLYFGSGYCSTHGSNRNCGQSVRPVCP